MKRSLGVLAAAWIGSGICTIAVMSAEPLPTHEESPQARDARMRWWREARFGLFIHWGVYAVPAGIHRGEPIGGIGEWIMHKGKIPIPEYEAYARRFNPVHFDARAWVQLAKRAGMKYIVITAKHHDGFCMWDSRVTDYDMVAFTPFGRDVLKELAESCEREGIRLGVYYSIMDWHHPEAKGESFPRYRDEYLIPQLKELLSGDYGDIGVLWFDGEWIKEWTEPQGKALYRMLREIKPDLIINNRIGKGRKGLQGMSRSRTDAGDFGTPEQRIPDKGMSGVDWESCMTMNRTWGYKSRDHRWKSETKLLRTLIDIASKGGNFLLNVGPTADGLIPEASVERLSRMGEWLDTNGEAIYGTRESPHPKPGWGRFTRKPGRLYAHVFEWPKERTITVPAAGRTLVGAYLLADKTKSRLNVDTTGEKFSIHLPAEAPDPIASVVVIEYKACQPTKEETGEENE